MLTQEHGASLGQQFFSGRSPRTLFVNTGGAGQFGSGVWCAITRHDKGIKEEKQFNERQCLATNGLPSRPFSVGPC